MAKLIAERYPNNSDSSQEQITKNPKSKICFAVLVHKDRELVKQLIENIKYYCPNSTIVLFNGGNEPDLCEGLGLPVCPFSRKLEHGFTTIYFLETMEWIEKLDLDYEYFINLDSDALFFRKGYEEFVQTQMKDTDYLAVNLKVAEDHWHIGNEMKKDLNRWKSLFSVNPLLGIFNVGQVMRRSFVQALLEPERKQKIKNVLQETISWGSDEILFVNMARELGFRTKPYPNKNGSQIIRHRPYFTIDELAYFLNNVQESWLCHPIHLDEKNPSRKLIQYLTMEQHTKEYKNKKYPWYGKDISLSLPIKTSFGNLEIIIRSENSLEHYWKDPVDKVWQKSATFANNVEGTPIFIENNNKEFMVVSKIKAGGIGYWIRDNQSDGSPWKGPFPITNQKIEPIMIHQKKNGRYMVICRTNGVLNYWISET